MNLKQILFKYKNIIAYLFFGVCTTLVNIVVYWICAYPLGLGTMESTVVAWIMAVLFAYVTNRKWVFYSEVHTLQGIAREMIAFFGCRLATGFVDLGCMFLGVQIMGLNDVVIKFLANVLVIILNFVASKLLIFRKQSEL